MTRNSHDRYSDDELDARFYHYFRHQIPDPFPAFEWPRVTTDNMANAIGSTINRSHLTLAASVCALLGLGLLASAPSKTVNTLEQHVRVTSDVYFQSSTASGKNLLKHVVKQPKE
jgi:hypothetical protein